MDDDPAHKLHAALMPLIREHRYYSTDFIDLIDAALAAERERCAQLIEKEADDPEYRSGMEHWHVGDMLSELAAAIRSLT